MQSLALRPAVRSKPRVIFPRTCASFAFSTSTAATSRSLAPRSLSNQHTPQTCLRIHILQKRCNASAATASVTPGSRPAASQSLTWNRFLELRKQRRRLSLVGSIICAFGCGLGGASTLFSPQLDLDLTAFGVDPFIVIGGTILASAGIGWLVGPVFGNVLFNVRYKSLAGQIAEKEKQFYARIKKFRVDPTSSSMQNPVPDYYGEKIGSVKDYRRWLKDQRAFNLKRGKML